MNIGLIGTGNRSIDLIKGINRVKNMKIVAVADPCRESVDRALKEIGYSVDLYANCSNLLERRDMDGVIIATPNDTHIPLGLEALRAGKALYLEKPMSIDVESCKTFIRFADERKARVMIGMQLRYSDVYKKMKAICDSGTIGDVKLIIFHALRNKFRPGVGDWRMQKRRSGGTILEVSVHQLDLFNWFSGSRIERVAAFGGRDAIYQQSELYDNVMLIAQYENGVKASLQAAVFTPQGGDDTGLCVVGTKGTVYETGKEIVVKLNNETNDILRMTTAGYADMDRNAMAAFMDMTLGGKLPEVQISDGLNAVEFAVLAEQSVLERREVVRG